MTPDDPQPPLVFLSDHEAAVVREATARLIPGPRDDPAEVHPGAREADVTRYIDRLLGAFATDPPMIYAAPGGGFLPLSAAQQAGWRRRLDTLGRSYHTGVTLLDRLAGGDFATASTTAARDAALSAPEAGPFRDLLFDHTVQGMYADPAYVHGRPRTGSTGLGFPGGPQRITGDSPTMALAEHFESAVRQLAAGTGDE